MDSRQYRKQAGPYRAYMRRVGEVGYHPAGYAGPAVAKPRGFDTPGADPLTYCAERRRQLLAQVRRDRAELARRAAERAEYAALGLRAPSYILSDRLLTEGLDMARQQHLRAVRGAYIPLASLCWREGAVATVALVRKLWAAA